MAIEVYKYKKEYHVKSYEVDCHGFLRVLSLMNWLQDSAVENADELGFGFAKCQELGVVWVGSNYLIKIDRLPRINEKIVIETWPAEGKLWGAIRNFTICDESGKVIVRARSQWVLIDFAKRRPVMLSKYFPQYCFLNEAVMDEDFHKLEALGADAEIAEMQVRFDDIDINNHVNNAVYLVWGAEGVGQQFRMEHVPAEIEVCFKKEALIGETIEVCSKLNGMESRHTIRDKNSGTDLADCRFVWRKITS